MTFGRTFLRAFATQAYRINTLHYEKTSNKIQTDNPTDPQILSAYKLTTKFQEAVKPLPMLKSKSPQANKLPTNVYQVLETYGFSSEQSIAIVSLLRKAEIPDIERLLTRDIKTTDELLTFLLDIVDVTQEHLTKRKNSIERWQSIQGNWINNKDSDLRRILSTLNLTDPITPTNADVDVIGWLGGRGKFVRERAKYAADLLDTNKLNAKHLVLMGGERIVTIDPNIDGSYQELERIVSNFRDSSDPHLEKFKSVAGPEYLTEFHVMMQAYWDNPSKKFKDLQLSTLYSQTTNGIRPTTESNILSFCEWLDKNPDVKSVVFISNQPYVQYQESVISLLFYLRKPEINVSVIGSEIDWVHAKPVGEFGTQVWASTAKMVIQNGWTTNDPKIVDRFMERYKGLPFVCQHLKESLQQNDPEARMDWRRLVLSMD